MNTASDAIIKKANEAAIYNLYLYLSDITIPAPSSTLRSIVAELEVDLVQRHYVWKNADIYRLSIIKNAINNNKSLANSKISDLTVSKSGLTSCIFTNQNGTVFVAFKGTGKGEWIDNGEGLSGIAEPNTYAIYKNDFEPPQISIKNDYATDQQVQALNWFNSIATKNKWNKNMHIIISGHSKGGNKAQFVAFHSDLADECYSFDGQGFSPEALELFKAEHKETYKARTEKIYSFSTDNDYVNVLGARLMPEDQIYYFRSNNGFHPLVAMLDKNGRLNQQSEQGRLSQYIETVSEKLMATEPFIRKYATLGVMNILQNFLGDGEPVNQDEVSAEQTIIGVIIALNTFLSPLLQA